MTFFLILQTAFDKNTSFVKIHAPLGVLKRNADILELKPPVKEFLVTAYHSTNKAVSIFKKYVYSNQNYQNTIIKSTLK